jgi:hypothetical protein
VEDVVVRDLFVDKVGSARVTPSRGRFLPLLARVVVKVSLGGPEGGDKGGIPLMKEGVVGVVVTFGVCYELIRVFVR